MRLKIRTWIKWKHDKFIAKEEREHTWCTWFAWRPVRINWGRQCMDELVWLETIVRKRPYNDSSGSWHYSSSELALLGDGQ